MSCAGPAATHGTAESAWPRRRRAWPLVARPTHYRPCGVRPCEAVSRSRLQPWPLHAARVRGRTWSDRNLQINLQNYFRGVYEACSSIHTALYYA